MNVRAKKYFGDMVKTIPQKAKICPVTKENREVDRLLKENKKQLRMRGWVCSKKNISRKRGSKTELDLGYNVKI